jgi:hypothetical protein
LFVGLVESGPPRPPQYQEADAMKYVLMFVDQGEKPGPEVYERINKWFETYGSKIVGGHELQAGSTATTVRFKNGQPFVTDGPFIEAKETIGGYAEVEVADLDEAIAMAKTWPSGGNVEIRPVVDDSQD